MDTSLILMATYNGAHFIREQIESILMQTEKKWHLIIRDDGSKDETVQIIQEYQENDKRIELIVNDGKKHGAYVNFWNLIEIAKKRESYKYYFFADQDDIWPKERMANMIKCAEQYEDNPLLLYGDMQIIDREGHIIFKSLNNIMGIGEMSGYTEFYSSGFVWGCNCLVNAKLFKIVPAISADSAYSIIMSHDNYYTKYALILGKVVYLNDVCINHRRYGNNTTGNYELRLSLLSVVKKALFGFSQLARTHALGYAQTMITIDIMKGHNQSNKDVLDIERAIYKGGIVGVYYLIKHKVRRKQFSRTVGIYTVMLFNSYKVYLKRFLKE